MLALALGLVTSVAKADFFGTPTNLGPTVNSGATDTAPGISADGLELYFMSNRFGQEPEHLGGRPIALLDV
jgi:hypothetical protein